MASTSSCRLIQLFHCRPLPSGAPRNALAARACFFSAPPAAGQHDAGPQVHHPGSRLLCGGRALLPLPADLGEEALSGRPGLVGEPVTGVAVPAHGTGGQQHPRPPGLRHRARHRGGALHPAVEHRLLVRGRPAGVGDARTGQVHHRVPVRDRVRVEAAAVPRPLVRRRRGAADEPHHVVPVGTQRGDEGGADEAGGAGDRDLHALDPALTVRRSPPGGGLPAALRRQRPGAAAARRPRDPAAGLLVGLRAWGRPRSDEEARASRPPGDTRICRGAPRRSVCVGAPSIRRGGRPRAVRWPARPRARGSSSVFVGGGAPDPTRRPTTARRPPPRAGAGVAAVPRGRARRRSRPPRGAASR